MKQVVCIIIVLCFLFSIFNAPGYSMQNEFAASPNTPAAQSIISTDIADPDKITIDLKGVDIVEALKLLAARRNMSVVVGSDVSGRVTMFLSGVNVMDALDMVILSCGLAYQKSGGIIYVMTQRNYENIYGENFTNKRETRVYRLKYAQAAQVAQALNHIKTKIGKVIADESSNSVIVSDSPIILPDILNIVNGLDTPTVTRVFELKYATAEDLRANIEKELTDNIGAIRIDDRTNKIVVTDLETKMPRISEMIAAFDEKTPQVLIEAKIVSVRVTDQLRLGINWESIGKLLNKKLDITSDFTITPTDASFFPPGMKIKLGTTDQSFWAIVDALKTAGDVNLLSSPRITAINNQEASIMVGKAQPYATNTVSMSQGTSITASQLTFMDIGVTLRVTPTINKDGFVTMKIRPEVSSSDEYYEYGDKDARTKVPIIETASTETSVIVKDGTTIIIGGLIVDQRIKTVKKVPFLGSIPYVGLLFSSTDDKVEKRELVVFLTPHIISGGSDMIEQPKTAPIGYKGFFTSSERMAFERRPDIPVDPAVFTEKEADRIRQENWERVRSAERYKDIISAPVVSEAEMAAAVEEYNYMVKARVYDKVASSRLKPSLKGSAKISFVISRTGSITGNPRIIEADNKAVGAAAANIVKAAAPFPEFSGKMDPRDKRFSIIITLD
jgi:type II secretory pathway component GspD/PulD (secretin)